MEAEEGRSRHDPERDPAMERVRKPTVWSSLDGLWEAGSLGQRPDGDLLDHFRRDPGATGQDAFRILVERHGAMVLGVCRNLLKDPHDADDAFQATFLVLVRRAESIRQRESLAPWLYGVACRVARKARVRSERRQKREVALVTDPPGRPSGMDEAPATDQALHEEMQRLPDSLRAPLILCCLEGQTYDRAARQLGLRESTLRGRIHRARKRLEDRLRRRGVLAPIVARQVEPGRFPLPSLAPSLVESTTRFAIRWTTLSSLLVGTGAVPGSIASLAQGVINAMLLHTVKVYCLAAVVAAGTVVVAQSARTGGQPPTASADAEPAPGPGGAVAQVSPRSQAPPIDVNRRTERILRILESRVELNLPESSSFDQFLKEIKRATTADDFQGIPIYVDPVGLQEANISMKTEVPVDQTGNLGFTLRQALRSKRLSSIVKNGYLAISSQTEITDQRLDELDRKLDRLLKAVESLKPANMAPSSGGRQH